MDNDTNVLSTPCPATLLQAPGKRIALPTRVEPKVFFANERTFLSWLNFTVILGSLAIGLLNFGDRVGRISASLFTLLAMGTMVYALITYHWRANAIRKRGSGPYDDRFGPTMLCFFLLIAVIVNFVLRIRAWSTRTGSDPVPLQHFYNASPVIRNTRKSK